MQLTTTQIDILKSILIQTENSIERISVQALWEKYAAFKKPQIAHSTWRNGYLTTTAHINRCPYSSLSEARAIADWLIENCTPDTARRQLVQLAAAGDWASKRQLIPHNPFLGMAQELRAKGYKLDCQPFTAQERQQIIKAYESHLKWNRYAALVKFLFLTGCRTSEALGLRWKNVAADFSSVRFCEAYVLGQWKGETKTGTRLFPCSLALANLLRSLKKEFCNPESPVFSEKGRPVSIVGFQNSWSGRVRGSRRSIGVVEALARDGAIACLRSQYHTRHTFISECLEQGIPVTTIAAWVGNSPEIIWKHYAASTGSYSPPELVSV